MNSDKDQQKFNVPETIHKEIILEVDNDLVGYMSAAIEALIRNVGSTTMTGCTVIKDHEVSWFRRSKTKDMTVTLDGDVLSVSKAWTHIERLAQLLTGRGAK